MNSKQTLKNMSRMQPKPRSVLSGNASRITNFAFLALIALIVLVPLPFGSARPWASAVLATWVAALLLMVMVAPKLDIYPPTKHLALPTYLFIAVVFWILIQASHFTPSSSHHDVWRIAVSMIDSNVNGAISADPSATYQGLMRWLSYAGVFYVAYLLGRDSDRAHYAVRAVMLSGSLYAAYGLIVYWSGNQTILWFPKWTYNSDLTGPFVNRNSFATYLGLALLAALSMLLEAVVKQDFPAQLSLRERLSVMIHFVADKALLLGCIFLIATALILTHSRGGFVSTLVGSIALVMAFTQTKHRGLLSRIGLVAIPFVLAAAALLISGDRLAARMMETDNDSFGRMAIFEATLKEVERHPLMGSGLGTFPTVFPIHRTAVLSGGEISKAHSDYLETVMELGLPATVCLLLAIAWLNGLCVRGILTRQRDAVFACLGLGASVLVGLHSVFDFSLQIPAVAATYFLLLGIAVAQSQSSRVGR